MARRVTHHEASRRSPYRLAQLRLGGSRLLLACIALVVIDLLSLCEHGLDLPRHDPLRTASRPH